MFRGTPCIIKLKACFFAKIFKTVRFDLEENYCSLCQAHLILGVPFFLKVSLFRLRFIKKG